MFWLGVALAAMGVGCSNDTVVESPPADPVEEADLTASAQPVVTTPPRTDLGSIAGRAVLVGKSPGNRVIRMGMDPKCALITEGKIVTDEIVVASPDGGLANVFAYLDGDIPPLPPSPEPVRIDQLGCVYAPHVVGVQVGQTVEILNSDDLLHNLHASSGAGNGFNVGQPQAGMVYRFQPKVAEIMMRLGCDVHRWMTNYIGIVDHPYFAVTANDGSFAIADIPAGTYTIRGWHEAYGEVDQTIEVRTGETTTVSFQYSAE